MNDREPTRPASPTSRFSLEEFTISHFQQAFERGESNSLAATLDYLDRIEALDRAGPELRNVLEINPQAVEHAQALDRERHDRRVRGPLHGIPILIKDNIETAGKMTTTAGSFALEGCIAQNDAFVVARLREAGAVILGKANLSEWANFRSSHSSSGWSARGGQVRNPYALDRSPSGSSSGSAGAVAANCCVAAVGTETDGSIVSPSAACSIVGIKPTVGLLSRSGIIPISHTQDTAGPMARTVEDGAILLGAMVGADDRDSATRAQNGKAHKDYRPFLKADGLKGARIGIAPPHLFGIGPVVDSVFANAKAAMKSAGAILIDPIELPALASIGDSEMTVLLHEFKAAINQYLRELGEKAPVKSLAELIAFNQANHTREMPFFGQDLFEKAQAAGALDDPKYLAALQSCGEASRRRGIDAVLQSQHLDAIVTITAGPPWLIDLVNGDANNNGQSSTLAAVAAYPSITVPAGYVFGLPVGMSFIGAAFSEPMLLRLAYAFEQITKVRRPPAFLSHARLSD